MEALTPHWITVFSTIVQQVTVHKELVPLLNQCADQPAGSDSNPAAPFCIIKRHPTTFLISVLVHANHFDLQ
jgi:hypothetical protein